MKTLPKIRWSLLAALALATATHAQTGVDLSPEQKGRLRAPKDEAAIAALPKNYKFVKPGVLTLAIHPAAPPTGTYATDAKTIVGFDPDFAQLVADALGLKLELQAVAWADWPLGLTAGKYDAVISNVGVTEQRKEKFDFSTYRLGLHGFYVRKDSKITSIKEPKDIAGLRVISASGTNQERIALEWNRLNVAAGLKPAELQYFDDEAARTLALLSGRADVNFNPNAPQAYQAAKDGQIKVVGTVNAGWPNKSDVAITTRKGSGLADAITQASNGLIKSGQYAQVLERWKLAEEALPKSETNPPGLPKF